MYIITLDDKRIGATLFESADPPMGSVTGLISFESIANPYEVFSAYCGKHNVPINDIDPEFEAIFTQAIEDLQAFNDKGVEIKGAGATISGFKDEGYFIDIFGIPNTLFADEFPHHQKRYEESFN